MELNVTIVTCNMGYVDRTALLDRLTDVAITTGFGADSLRDLASASGSSARMLMYYFTSREELLAEIARNLLTRFRQMLGEQAQEPAEVDGATAVTRLWHTLSARRNEGLLRSLFQLSGSALAGKDGLEPFRGAVIDELRGAVVAVLAQGGSQKRPLASAVTISLWGGASALVMTGDRNLANEAVLEMIERLMKN